ncbi:MAG: hypothetical protein ACYDCO_13375 [Armatimonadota bacterium]
MPPFVEAAQAAGQEDTIQEDPSEDTEEDAEEEEPAGEETSGEEPQGWRISNWKVDGRLDYRLMNMREPGMTTTTGELMAAEIETTATISNKDRDILDLAVQFPYVTQMEGIDDRGKQMHFGNAYGIYKFGLGKPNVRFGQFVVPFGNLPYYETHTRPLQSLYPESLGVRIDRGVSLEGMAGEYDYSIAAMNGNGARGDNNGSPVGITRASRRFDLESGTLTAGVSALYGKDMPRFSTLVDPLMDDEEMLDGMLMDPAVDFTDKSRVALDAEYSAGQNLWRAELIAGRDGDGAVNGQFLQWNRTLDEKHEVTLQATRWEQPGGTRTRLGVGGERKLDQYSTIRLYAERALGHTPMEDRNSTIVGIQYLREFPSLFGK